MSLASMAGPFRRSAASLSALDHRVDAALDFLAVVPQLFGEAVSIETVEKCAQDDLARLGLDEIIGDAPLFRFRLGGRKRLWGFRSDRVFHAVWWDTDHAVYKATK